MSKMTTYSNSSGLLLVALLSALPAFAQSITAVPTAPTTPWDERTREERAFKGRYEDHQTFKHKKPYFLDPYLWAYSRDFAERFRMPAEWVDPELRGAMAVAWRMTAIGQTMCGLAGRPDNCWPPLTCQMEIYFDDSSPLPWRFNDVVRDNFMRGISSSDVLPSQSRDSRTLRYGDMGDKGLPLRNGAFNYLSSRTTTSGFQITYFDRAFEPGVSLVGFTNACPRAGLDDGAQLRFFSEEEFQRTRGAIKNYAHTVTFSRSFMKKLADAYQAQNKPNEDITWRIIQDFFDSRRGDPNFEQRR